MNSSFFSAYMGLIFCWPSLELNVIIQSVMWCHGKCPSSSSVRCCDIWHGLLRATCSVVEAKHWLIRRLWLSRVAHLYLHLLPPAANSEYYNLLMSSGLEKRRDATVCTLEELERITSEHTLKNTVRPAVSSQSLQAKPPLFSFTGQFIMCCSDFV